MSARVRPVILCGGAGTRLWPLSTPDRPKQFLEVAGSGTLLQETLGRVARDDLFAAPWVIAAAEHEQEVRRQAASCGSGIDLLLLEPAGRNTAPAAALAALVAAKGDLLLLLPSDHIVRDALAFRDAVARALPWAEAGYLMTFGARPTRAETGYGYVQRGAALTEGVYEVARFTEKPDVDTATRLIRSGTHDWNSGMFLAEAGTLRAALELHAPDVLRRVADALGEAENGTDCIRAGAAFAEARSVSLDRAVMEKAARIGIAPVDMGWSDVGSWDAIYEAASKDAAGNVVAGPVTTIACHNLLARTSGLPVIAIGVRDLTVVATETGILIVAHGESQRLSEAGLPAPGALRDSIGNR